MEITKLQKNNCILSFEKQYHTFACSFNDPLLDNSLFSITSILNFQSLKLNTVLGLDQQVLHSYFLKAIRNESKTTMTSKLGGWLCQGNRPWMNGDGFHSWARDRGQLRDVKWLMRICKLSELSQVETIRHKRVPLKFNFKGKCVLLE